jgi:hypothetical protein
MDDLLLALAELLFEFLLEIAGEVVLDLLTRAGAAVFGSEDVAHPVGTWLACVFYGLLAGAVSLAVIPHPVFHRSKMHGISLIVSPVLTGTVMSGIGTLLWRHRKRVVQIESFPYAFAFALGMALIRFLFAS